jgi:hypothetical protein
MQKLFMVLSTPVRTDDGAYAVVAGSIAGCDVKRFAARPEAESYFRILVGSLRIAVEIPFEFVVIDSETDFWPAHDKVAFEIERLSRPYPAIPGPLAALTARLGAATTAVIGGWRRGRR